MPDEESIVDQELVNPLALRAVLRTQPLLNIGQQPPRFGQPDNSTEIRETDVRARQANIIRANNPKNCLIEGRNAAEAIRIVVKEADLHMSSGTNSAERTR